MHCTWIVTFIHYNMWTGLLYRPLLDGEVIIEINIGWGFMSFFCSTSHFQNTRIFFLKNESGKTNIFGNLFLYFPAQECGDTFEPHPDSPTPNHKATGSRTKGTPPTMVWEKLSSIPYICLTVPKIRKPHTRLNRFSPHSTTFISLFLPLGKNFLLFIFF